jgi:hypothetical protein
MSTSPIRSGVAQGIFEFVRLTNPVSLLTLASAPLMLVPNAISGQTLIPVECIIGVRINPLPIGNLVNARVQYFTAGTAPALTNSATLDLSTGSVAATRVAHVRSNAWANVPLVSTTVAGEPLMLTADADVAYGGGAITSFVHLVFYRLAGSQL